MNKILSNRELDFEKIFPKQSINQSELVFES